MVPEIGFRIDSSLRVTELANIRRIAVNVQWAGPIKKPWKTLPDWGNNSTIIAIGLLIAVGHTLELLILRAVYKNK